jgi:hypothetical protein
MEALESRTLLSATWSTVFSDPAHYELGKLTADRNGNVYALADDTSPDVVFEKASGSAQWTPIYRSVAGGFYPNDIAADAAGDLFLGGRTSTTSGGTWSILERRAGQTSFRVVDSLSDWPSGCYGLATDAAGDVYAGGYDYVTTTTTVTNGKKATTTTSKTSYGIIRELTPTATGYSAATIYRAPGGAAGDKITVIESGNSAGIYALGSSASPGVWQAIKSTNGGATWSTIGSFGPDSNETPQIVADLSGNLYISGWPAVSSYTNNWTVRESSDGGATWSIADNFIYPGSWRNNSYAMGTDLQGNVYIGGVELTYGSPTHGIIRTNAGGTWVTIDDIAYDYYRAFTVDSSGTLYAGGQTPAPSTASGLEAFIRSAPGPTAPTLLSAAPDPVQPSTQIDLTFSSGGDAGVTGLQLFRSTNGGAFAPIATLVADATSFTDSNLSPGTTYSYYLVSLINQDGSSDPSNILTVSTLPGPAAAVTAALTTTFSQTLVSPLPA